MLKQGDVVAKKSGGYLMTIESINDNKANCIFFDDSGNLNKNQIEIDLLQKWSKDIID